MTLTRRNLIVGGAALSLYATLPTPVHAVSKSRAYHLLAARLHVDEAKYRAEQRKLLWTFINRYPKHVTNVLPSRSGCRRVYCPGLPYMTDAELREKGISKAMVFDHLCQLMNHTLSEKKFGGVYSVFNYTKRGNKVFLFAEVK